MALQKVKVYELAKELGIDSITLIDKLKQLDIDVKSHMSALGTEEVKIVRDQIAKEQALMNKAAKSTRKAAAEPVVQKRVGTTVIRRRVKASDEAAATSQAAEAPAPEPQVETIVHRHTETGEIITEEPRQAAPAEEFIQEAGTPAEEQQEAPVEEAAPTEIPASEPVVAKPVHKGLNIQVTSRAIEREPQRPAAPQAPRSAPLVRPRGEGSGLKIPSLLGARSEGFTTTRAGNILNVVKEEPRRPPPVAPRGTPLVRPLIPGQPALPRGGQVTVTLGKEQINRLVEEEQSYKKKGATRGERERQPTDVKVSDYRAKKELVFLPKKKKVPTNKEIRHTEITTPAQHKRVVKIENAVTVSELASRMGVKAGDVMRKLIGMGVMATLNHTLDLDTATLLGSEFGYEIQNVAFKEEDVLQKVEDKTEDLQPRPPIVTVMGHVDHGKTSLLDAIRSTKVAAGEAGGITQHIGAYTVDVSGKKVTFIDTPGHEAFTMMRSRGANVTDIVILVVAADDGVMPQTREAVDHAKAAGVPIIVAVNKIDKPGANPDKVTKGLSELGLIPEAWGGENIFINVSALKKTGLPELLESILLQAEVLELKANPNRTAEGTVLEAKLDKNRGPVVNVLIKKGTLNLGDTVVAGTHLGRVRALVDDKGRNMKSVGPGYAAELLGLEGVPLAGDTFNSLTDEAEARRIVEHRANKAQAQAATPKNTKMSLEELFSKVQTGETKELPIVLKTDAFGSAEAIKESLSKQSTDQVKVKVISSSTGGISESDVMLASASNAIIVGFNVRPETKARAIAEVEKVEIKNYTIIYELLDDIRKAMAGLLDKKAVEKYLGRAEVRELFNVPKIGTVAGTFVVDGKVTRGASVRLLRDNRVVYTGKLSSLRRFKDDAKEVAQGYECGMGIENFNDLKQGDIIEAFQIEMVAQELNAPATAEAGKA